MTPSDLQAELQRRGTYSGRVDGLIGPLSKAALLVTLAAGPDTPICDADIRAAAQSLGCAPAAVKAVWSVEAAGAGFEGGRPKILPEPHRFSKLTGGRYDAAHPDLSWAVWTPGRYPPTQVARYAQLCDMVALDVDAGFAACSYGAFQILGENAALCGFASPWAMAYGLSLTEGKQLDAFCNFVHARRLDAALRDQQWAVFAAGFNGTAYRSNAYDQRLAAAYGRFA